MLRNHSFHLGNILFGFGRLPCDKFAMSSLGALVFSISILMLFFAPSLLLNYFVLFILEQL